MVKKLKLYVWTGVLTDYTSGMAFAVAPDLEIALKILADKAGYSLDLPIEKMQVFDLKEPVAFYVYGGG